MISGIIITLLVLSNIVTFYMVWNEKANADIAKSLCSWYKQGMKMAEAKAHKERYLRKMQEKGAR